MTTRVFARTGATEALANHDTVIERCKTIDVAKYPYLAATGAFLADGLRVDQSIGMQVAMALAPDLHDRDKFIASVVDSERVGLCKDLLAYNEQSMDRKVRDRVMKEIALVMGSIQ